MVPNRWLIPQVCSNATNVECFTHLAELWLIGKRLNLVIRNTYPSADQVIVSGNALISTSPVK